MMVKEKNNLAFILRHKCEMFINHKGFNFETSDKVF